MTGIPATGNTPTTTASAGDVRSQRLHTAANQFEAMLLQEMLKPLAAKPEEGSLSSSDSDGQSSGPLQGFGIQAMAESLARSGALGFAKQIEHALSAHGSKTPDAK